MRGLMLGNVVMFPCKCEFCLSLVCSYSFDPFPTLVLPSFNSLHLLRPWSCPHEKALRLIAVVYSFYSLIHLSYVAHNERPSPHVRKIVSTPGPVPATLLFYVQNF